MKIAFIINQEIIPTSPFNGIRQQALIWKEAIEKKGHEVDLLTPWEFTELSSYDIVHVFGKDSVLKLLPNISKKNKNLVLSPIIDAQCSTFKYKLASYVGFDKLRLYSDLYLLRKYAKYVGLYLARTKYESAFLTKGFNISDDKVDIVPLSYRVLPADKNDSTATAKEKICLHVSTFTQPRKNVMRLIEAAIKYQFRLVLAGDPGSESDFQPFKDIIDSNENITWEGIVSDNELIELYKKAKVFALPSIYEGVGMVALEAAVYGAEIVITNMGGPKEYYGNLAAIVNPYSVDDIGKAVINLMKKTTPSEIQEHVISRYNLSKNVDSLLESYQKIINQNN